MTILEKHLQLDENEEKESKDKTFDAKLEELLIKKRRIFFSCSVTSETAREAIRKLWYLEHTDPGKPIIFVINSAGGSVSDGFAIWDQIHMISSPVYTLITGLAASMGSVLSLAASPKKRFATPHARIMLHQPLIPGVIQGQATDLEIQAREIIKTRNTLIKLYADKTGQKFSVIEKTIDRDTWMSAQEAKDFGLLDEIVSSYSKFDFD